MAEQTTQPPNELDRAAEEAGFYHEAALNAAWTGSRFAVGGLAFLYGCFAFAYFYLRSVNSSGRWKGSGFHAPQIGYGVTILVLVLLSARRAVRGAAADQGRGQERLAGGGPRGAAARAWPRWSCRSSSC